MATLNITYSGLSADFEISDPSITDDDLRMIALEIVSSSSRWAPAHPANNEFDNYVIDRLEGRIYLRPKVPFGTSKERWVEDPDEIVKEVEEEIGLSPVGALVQGLATGIAVQIVVDHATQDGAIPLSEKHQKLLDSNKKLVEMCVNELNRRFPVTHFSIKS